MKQYVGISRDHSVSMTSLARKAMDDYNKTISQLKSAGSVHGIETILSVVRCGERNTRAVGVEIINKDILRVEPISSYETRAPATPLWDSVDKLITILEAVPDASNPDTSFLVMSITDGEENCSTISTVRLAEKIRRLQNTDRWTFVFRVPRGYGEQLRAMGISEGNIQEWDQTQAGFETATKQTEQSFANYYQARASGVRSTGTFFANIGALDKRQVINSLVDITNKVIPYAVNHTGEEISTFMGRVRGSYQIGTAYYQLTKSETIQPNKKILVLDTKTGAMYTGSDARHLLGLPDSGYLQLRPGNLGNFKVFIQSTSTNRKLVGGTLLYYYPG